MYRPNRIGPHPLLNIDRAPKAYGSITTFQAINVISPVLPDATIRESTASRQFNGTLTGLTSGAQFAIGIAVDGSNPIGELAGEDDPGMVISMSGYMWLKHSSSNNAPPHVVLARNDAAALATSPAVNPCANYQMIPTDNSGVDGKDSFFSWASFNRTVLLGNYDGAITYSGDPLILAWVYQNPDAGTLNLVFEGMLTLHKYIIDLDTLDPNRP